jgi:hypothetical protein
VAAFSVVEGEWTMLSLNQYIEAEMLNPDEYGELQAIVDSAKQALARQESVAVGAIDLLRLEPFAAADGVYQVVLSVNGRSFEYHISDEEALYVPAGTPLEPTPNDDETANNFDFMTTLRETGAEVEVLGTLSQSFFPIDGQRIAVDGQTIELYAFDGEAAAAEMVAQISADGSQIGRSVVDWIAPPHFYENGNLIVLYVGEDPRIIMLLESLLGPQFAGDGS